MSHTFSLLIIIRQLLSKANLAENGIHLAMANGMLEQPTGVFFYGDGVWNLVNEKKELASKPEPKSALLKSLALYNLESLYVDGPSLLARQINFEDLAVACEVMAFPKLQTQYKQILNF